MERKAGFANDKQRISKVDIDVYRCSGIFVTVVCMCKLLEGLLGQTNLKDLWR